ncbi:MAG: metal-dependent transcriptional regulator [Ignavibacteriales bacterium]|nr:metal-dependent transcriptional regulator [Ignavibacteriales bacterium]
MTDPLQALLIGGSILLVVAVIFFPKYGLIARWSRAKRGIKRVQIEDALKHIYDCEYNNIPCTVQSIAGALVISSDDAAELVARLSSMGLLLTLDNGVKLTADGNSYALRVIRVHRLWERYLADETSVPQTEWHSSAELQEHKLTPAQTEALAAQIGNPHFDPHGDPIPTPTGEIPPKKGRSFLSMNQGDFGVITHIEDEPEAVFAQLSAEGLYVGMHIMLIERSNERVRFAADGDEIVLAPVLANNITVEMLENEKEKIVSPMDTLASINIGEEATVLNISKACRGQQRRRLLDLGIVPGTKVRAEMRSASGDPTAYNVRGALVALRKQHAQMIFVQK